MHHKSDASQIRRLRSPTSLWVQHLVKSDAWFSDAGLTRRRSCEPDPEGHRPSVVRVPRCVEISDLRDVEPLGRRTNDVTPVSIGLYMYVQYM